MIKMKYIVFKSYKYYNKLKKNGNLMSFSISIHFAFPESTILLFNNKGKQYISRKN